MRKEDDSKNDMDKLLERLIEEAKKYEAEKDSLCPDDLYDKGYQEGKDAAKGDADG